MVSFVTNPFMQVEVTYTAEQLSVPLNLDAAQADRNPKVAPQSASVCAKLSVPCGHRKEPLCMRSS